MFSWCLTLHVLATAHGGLDFSLAGWALGNAYLAAVVEFEHVINQRFFAGFALHIDSHVARGALINCHIEPL